MDTRTQTYDDFPGPVTAIDDARMTVAAAFPDRASAHAAAHELHAEGFRDTWIGIARADDGEYGYADTAQQDQPQADPEIRVESDNWFMRFFGEGDESLADALVRHGVSDADARAAGTLEPHAALLTVDGTNHPESAAHIIMQHGGRLITRGFGATGYGTPDDQDPAAARDDYGRYRAGTPIDESTRLQLREERLRVDKSRVARDDATVGTHIGSESHEFDEPFMREELFIERRPARSATSLSGASSGGTGDPTDVRIPHGPESVVEP